jgi:hypothetical protein
MPGLILCRYCKQPINKETDQYVVIEKGTERHPEALAHVRCETKESYGVRVRRVGTEVLVAWSIVTPTGFRRPRPDRPRLTAIDRLLCIWAALRERDCLCGRSPGELKRELKAARWRDKYGPGWCWHIKKGARITAVQRTASIGVIGKRLL